MQEEQQKPLLTDGYPVLTEMQVRRIAQSFIPPKFRPYYIGCIIRPLPMMALIADCSITLCFINPVVGNMRSYGARTIVTSLEAVMERMDCLRIDDTDECRKWYAEWDKAASGLPVVSIADDKPLLDEWKKCCKRN